MQGKGSSGRTTNAPHGTLGDFLASMVHLLSHPDEAELLLRGSGTATEQVLYNSSFMSPEPALAAWVASCGFRVLDVGTSGIVLRQSALISMNATLRKGQHPSTTCFPTRRRLGWRQPAGGARCQPPQRATRPLQLQRQTRRRATAAPSGRNGPRGNRQQRSAPRRSSSSSPCRWLLLSFLLHRAVVGSVRLGYCKPWKHWFAV